METLQEISEEEPVEEDGDKQEEEEEKSESEHKERKREEMTLYEKVLLHANDPKLSHEIGLSRISLYKFCGDIGKGNFSRVKKAIHTLTKDKVAIKIVDRSRLDSRNLQMLSREVKTLENLSLHPHIIRLFEVIETVGRVYIVTEYLQGELYYHIVQKGVLPESRASRIFRQLAEAIQYIHHLGFVHRDIKAENVLLTADENVKLCDFGFSTQVRSSREFLNTFCGSPPYASPELFQEENNYSGQKVDVWSLGILLYFILIGNMPFSAPSIGQLKATILKGEYKLPGTLSQPCVKLIQCILLHNPSQRPSIDVILGCEWLQNQQKIQEQLEMKKLEEVRTTIQKRKAFWCTKSRRTSPLPAASQPQSPAQKPFIECYTKKYNNVPLENFRNPLEQEVLLMASSTKTIIPINNNISTTFKRNNSLINSSKVVHRKPLQLSQRHDAANGSQDTACSDDRSESNEVDFESFIMYPTRAMSSTSSARTLNPLEQEVRKIMNSYGIGNEKIESEIANAPHSQIIGIYRILIIRLLHRREQAEKKVKTPPPVVEKKTKRKKKLFCSIL